MIDNLIHAWGYLALGTLAFAVVAAAVVFLDEVSR